MKRHACQGFVLLVLLSGIGTKANAQFINFGSGHTVQGDYLHGLGAAAYGMGYYNEATARAGAINLNSAIRYNDYVNACTEYDTEKYRHHVARMIAEHKALWQQRQEQIRNNPNEQNVRNGESLNKEMEELTSPRIATSAFRYSPVTLPIDMVRTIPFRLNERNASFSLQGLSVKGKKTWEIALRNKEFDAYRHAYENALKAAKAEQVKSKTSTASILALEKALDDLKGRLDQVVGVQRSTEYISAKNQLEGLKRAASQLHDTKIERIFADLDTYSGTTVEELKTFMNSHRLSFGPAQSPEEIVLYVELYQILKDQRQKVAVAAKDDEGKLEIPNRN